VTVGKNGIDKRKEGDKRTPIGLYFANGALPKSRLTDFYGSGAYPINYPNEWDKREGRGGHGIWLHGVPRDTYSRPPRASDGCVVLSNEDLESLAKHLDQGQTPVIVTDRIDWVSVADLNGLRADMYKNVEAWRRDWESRNVDAYLRHYSRQFAAGKTGYDEFSEQKRRVGAGKEWIRVRLGEVSMFLYPGRHDLAVVNFKQYYSGNNLTNEMMKRQYWKKEGGGWRIVYEGAAWSAITRRVEILFESADAPTRDHAIIAASPTTQDHTMVKLHTNFGVITLELDAAKAPITVENFLEYVRNGFYANTVFHRVIDGFMIQGGGFEPGMKQKPTGDNIQNEAANGLKNDKYTIAMARTPDPHSASSQFFINVSDNSFLNYKGPTPQEFGYCVFGKVVEGMEVVDQIKKVKTGNKGFHGDVPVDDVVISKAEGG